jgi:hypothetical protein
MGASEGFADRGGAGGIGLVGGGDGGGRLKLKMQNEKGLRESEGCPVK